ncbi:helix-turn-helix transcriptional regulator [Actinomadura keratinilytica]|jgi:transcriptional regulator with XRE-family HTH domain|uniref:HTH cro/C1-type domain-containing protein n=1 Tax=Actinomadura keratinilytica TaxID=547461 RepID=A0ABP7YJY7_9ACTN
MTTADERRRIGALLQAERRRRRWSKPETARRLALHVPDQCPDRDTLISYIKRWEAGKVSISERYRFAYAAAFDMDVGELFGQAAARPPDELTAGALDPPDSDGRPADMEYAANLRETGQTLVKLDTLYGGNDVFPLALRVFRDARRKLAVGAYEPKVERDLVAAAGEIGEIAAWLAYDADRQAESRQIILEALLLSRQAGDRNMELFELTHMSMQSVYLGHPAEALRITDGLLRAQHLAPRVAAVLNIRRGRALAQLGDRNGAFDALDNARSAIADGINERDPYWTWWVTETEIAWQKGMAHAELGDWRAAVPLFYETVAGRTASRRALHNDRIHLLDALVHTASWADAEQVIGVVSGQLGEVGSSRGTNLLRRIVRRMADANAPSTVTDIALDLRERLDENPL